MACRSSRPSTTGPTCSPRWPPNSRTWPSSTSGCRRRSPTRASGPRWPPGARCPACRCWCSPQYVEQLYARELLASGSGGIGYLLKDRVFDSGQFVDAVRRVAAGGTAMDPEVIARLLARNTGDGTLAALSPREREVLALMAEGRSNAAIAQRLVITERAVAKHTASIFLKLDLQPSDDDNRRVLAVLAYLGG